MLLLLLWWITDQRDEFSQKYVCWGNESSQNSVCWIGEVSQKRMCYAYHEASQKRVCYTDEALHKTDSPCRKSTDSPCRKSVCWTDSPYQKGVCWTDERSQKSLRDADELSQKSERDADELSQKSVTKQSQKFCPEAIVFLQTLLMAALDREERFKNLQSQEHHMLHEPLKMRKKKAVPIRMLHPKFEENYVEGRDYDPDRERAEKKKLKKRIKEEAKGVA
ncbi:hypothetical protein CQW23_25459 [Capsicum baccatum]|uniref:Uncharacterized protein n=1 Tax=Capsicum baccatum TaxID=33114 RepID=A0A2G2VL28_CAPBA|nr:hypothetical protein CQW23_25459 [Capsicum baccatum]